MWRLVPPVECVRVVEAAESADGRCEALVAGLAPVPLWLEADIHADVG